MVIGVPKEIKDQETRVALVPSGVTALREAGHEVLIQSKAGEGSAITDRESRDDRRELTNDQHLSPRSYGEPGRGAGCGHASDLMEIVVEQNERGASAEDADPSGRDAAYRPRIGADACVTSEMKPSVGK